MSERDCLFDYNELLAWADECLQAAGDVWRSSSPRCLLFYLKVTYWAIVPVV